jgi:hypothetical protein
MRIAPFAVTTTVMLTLAAAGSISVTAADRLIPFAADLDIEPQAQHVAAGFIDTSACDRMAAFVSGTTITHLRLTFRIGVPDGDTIVRTGIFGGFNGQVDETGGTYLWDHNFGLMAPRVQAVLTSIHPSAVIHVNKAWLYCKRSPRR